jgi:hypothetical protein
MTYGTDADFLQVFFEAQSPRPDHNVHEGPQAPRLQHSIVRAGPQRSLGRRVALYEAAFRDNKVNERVLPNLTQDAERSGSSA